MSMMCANKDCGAALKYLRGGRLFLMERQQILEDSTANGKPQPAVVLRRYFWLCESCSQVYTIRQWTEAGVELAPRTKRARSAAALPRDWNLPGMVG